MSATAAALGPAPAAQPPAYLAGAALVLVTLALATGNFMEVLDTTIANVSIPAIAGDLGVSPSQGTWVITSYAVANAISVLTAGWLAQRFGQVRVFTTAVLLFTFASFMCGLAESFEVLLAFRVMQGAVSGLMVPLSQTLLMGNYSKERQGLALAFWGMTVTVAPVLGPILGGYLTDNAGWEWIFYINVPVGLTAAALIWFLLRGRETPTSKLPIDAVGLAAIVIWVGALQIMLDKGNELDWFDSNFIVALGLVAAIGFVFFFIWEWYEPHPIVDLRLFGERNFRSGAIVLSLGYGVFFATVVLIPMWLQTQQGYTATWAGFVLAPVGIFAILLSPPVGRAIGRVDPRIFATVAFAIFSIASFWRSSFTTTADYWTYAAPQVLMGAGVAMYFAPLIAITLGNLPPERAAFGSGLSNFLRITAGSFAASIVVTIWDDRQALHQSQLVEHVTLSDPAAQNALSALGQLGLGQPADAAQLARLVEQQAYMLAANDIFWVSGWIFLLLIGAVWLARRPTRAVAGH